MWEGSRLLVPVCAKTMQIGCNYSLVMSLLRRPVLRGGLGRSGCSLKGAVTLLFGWLFVFVLLLPFGIRYLKQLEIKYGRISVFLLF